MNLDKIRKKLNKLEEAQKPSPFKRLWKPEVGTSQIRLVPNPKNKDYPFFELGFYYDLTDRTIISPQNFGDPDPVIEFVEQLKSSGDRDDWKLARKLEPRTRFYAPILVRGREEEGVFLWGFGKTVFEEILRIIDDPDYGDITDLQNGTDLTVEYTKPPAGEGYPKTTFRPKRHSSPATEDPEVVKLLDDVLQPEDIWRQPSYDELSEILDNFINNKSSDEEVEESVEEETTGDSVEDIDTSDFPSGDDPQASLHDVSKETLTETKTTEDIDKEFDKLFNAE